MAQEQDEEATLPGGEKASFKIDWRRIKAAHKHEQICGERLSYDPDKDGFNFGYEHAVPLRVRMNMFRLIRKEIVALNFRFWDWAKDELADEYGSWESIKNAGLPTNWDVNVHDKALFKVIAREGIPGLSKLKNNKDFGFEGMNVSKKKMLSRIEDMCLYFRNNVHKFKNYLRRFPGSAYRSAGDGFTGKTKLDPNKINTSIKVEYDDEQNVVYPIHVSNTLRILNLGVIEWERPTFHSARNLLPIGYKAVRTYQSMFYKEKKCEYICEILDNVHGPLYKVTSEEDPDNPIIHDASSGAWIEICKKINELYGNQRNKVTVSGPDRFGIAEPAVTQLLAGLPNARSCHKFRPPNGWPDSQ